MMTERMAKRLLCCPVCGRALLKFDGVCDIEVTCCKCNRELVAHVDNDILVIREDRRENGKPIKSSVCVRTKKNAKLATVPALT